MISIVPGLLNNSMNGWKQRQKKKKRIREQKKKKKKTKIILKSQKGRKGKEDRKEGGRLVLMALFYNLFQIISCHWPLSVCLTNTYSP